MARPAGQPRPEPAAVLTKALLRAAELRDWIEAGEYDRLLRGEYRRRGEPNTPYMDDLRAAADAYKEDASDLKSQVGDAARRMRDAFKDGFKKG